MNYPNHHKRPAQNQITPHIFVAGLAGMSFGFFLSTVCDTSMDAMKLSIGACFPHMLATGIIWPLEGMPAQWMVSVVSRHQNHHVLGKKHLEINVFR